MTATALSNASWSTLQLIRMLQSRQLFFLLLCSESKICKFRIISRIGSWTFIAWFNWKRVSPFLELIQSPICHRMNISCLLFAPPWVWSIFNSSGASFTNGTWEQKPCTHTFPSSNSDLWRIKRLQTCAALHTHLVVGVHTFLVLWSCWRSRSVN